MILIETLTAASAYWQAVIDYAAHCSWKAGPSLAQAMQGGAFSCWERVFAARDGENIAGFCTLAQEDCIANLPYSPYIGYVFVGEPYRGHRLSEKLCRAAMDYAQTIGFAEVYLISDHVQLYEKFGFIAIDKQRAPWGAMETVYRQTLPYK